MSSEEPSSFLFSLTDVCSLQGNQMQPSFEYEKYLLNSGFYNIAGTDEAGRGPLCGPVVAACVILDPKNLPEGLNDSKKMTPVQRDSLYLIIQEKAVSIGIGIIDEKKIDKFNILRSSIIAMTKAFQSIKPEPDFILIDGNRKLPLKIHQSTIIKGDSKCMSIAAASIIAKVIRDRIMMKLHTLYPEYKLAKNKGYPTKEHFFALSKFGPSKIHRRSFKPVKEILTKNADHVHN
jgi:ribonuclease HII